MANPQSTAPDLTTRALRFGLETYLHRFGWRLIRKTGTTAHDRVFPLATYSPWNMDPVFVSTYEAIRSHSLVDLYRCWELWTLTGQAAKMGGAMLEVGVWRGGTGALIAKRAGGITTYLADTFTGVVKASQKDPEYRGGEHADTSVPIVESLLRSLGVRNARILQGIFPEDTGGDVTEPIAMCHIDVDTYQSAKDVNEWVWPRLVDGGIVVYDDFGTVNLDGVREYVESQIGCDDRLVLHNLNGHAVVIKRQRLMLQHDRRKGAEAADAVSRQV